MKVFSYTVIGLLVSFGLFTFARMVARPPPESMTKEYQEMTNEYLRVRIHSYPFPCQASSTLSRHITSRKHTADNDVCYRTKMQNQSPAYPPKATPAKVMCKASPKSPSRQHTLFRSKHHPLHRFQMNSNPATTPHCDDAECQFPFPLLFTDATATAPIERLCIRVAGAVMMGR